MVDLVILAGGYGSRLKNITKNKQKTMICFYGKPFLKHLIEFYSNYNLNKIYIILGYKGQKAFKEFNNTKINKVKINCVIEKKPKGTAVALLKVKNKISKKFIRANGDTFIKTDINKLANAKIDKKLGCCIVVKKEKNLSSCKLNTLSIKNRMLNINHKGGKYISSGLMLLSKKIFSLFDKESRSFEIDVLKKAILRNKIYGVFEKNYFIDIGTKFYLKKSKKELIKYIN